MARRDCLRRARQKSCTDDFKPDAVRLVTEQKYLTAATDEDYLRAEAGGKAVRVRTTRTQVALKAALFPAAGDAPSDRWRGGPNGRPAKNAFQTRSTVPVHPVPAPAETNHTPRIGWFQILVSPAEYGVSA